MTPCAGVGQRPWAHQSFFIELTPWAKDECPVCHKWLNRKHGGRAMGRHAATKNGIDHG